MRLTQIFYFLRTSGKIQIGTKGEDRTIEYLQNDVEILDYCMNEYVKLSIYVILPVYSFDCWLISSGFILDTLQDKQVLDDFFEAKRGAY